MTHLPSFSDRLRCVFDPSPRGVVGLVDNLLELCRDHQLRLDFQDDHCRVRPLGSTGPDAIDVPMPKSVFRAVVARIAALCNERRANAVTPYGGHGELGTADSATVFHVAFANTPAEQWVELKCVTTPVEAA